MLMLRMVLILGLAVINSYPAAEVPPPPPMEEGDETPPPPPAPEKETEIIPGPPAVEEDGQEAPPPAPPTFEQHLATTAKVFIHPKGPITAYTFNQKDPWIANIMMHEAFSYQAKLNDIFSAYITGALISADGNRVICKHIGRTTDNDVYELFVRQQDGSWKHVSLSSYTTDYRAETPVLDFFAANGALNRIAIVKKTSIDILDYNAATKDWSLQEIQGTYNLSIESCVMNTTGNLLALKYTFPKISFYYNHNNIWHPTPKLELPIACAKIHMGGDGKYIVAPSSTGLKIFECSIKDNKVTCKEIKDIVLPILVSASAISDNGTYLALATFSTDTVPVRCEVYRQQNGVWSKTDSIDLSRQYPFKPRNTPTVRTITINNNGNCIVMGGDYHGSSYVFCKLAHSWQAMDILEGKRLNTLAASATNNRIVTISDKMTMHIISILLPELVKLNANQLNFIRDLYEQSQVIQKSDNKNAWIILAPDDVQFFKTIPKDIQLALRTVYKLTTQESIDTAQRKLKEKNKDQKTAAQSVTTSTAAHK